MLVVADTSPLRYLVVIHAIEILLSGKNIQTSLFIKT
jgi:hypothetical protein